MSRTEKLNELLDLLLVLQNSYTGKTYDELQEMYGFNRRRLERMMSILVEQFGDKIETVDLINSINDTNSISQTLSDKIKKIKETVEKIDLKPASKSDEEEEKQK